MDNKSGLLPKWLILSTTLHLIFIISQIYMQYIKTDFKVALFSSFLCVIKLIGIKRMGSVFFYVVVALATAIHSILFILFGVRKIVNLNWCLFEVILGILTLGWMIFLYPYYLMQEDINHKKND
ncbi:hypothetical protein H312_00712 [Anncaliia algerae PRA339]|uniref:Uncharacterized protein n=1 Tax=Anncaliia algerae PRA339 TaxID=1288291 RepID=A0A059F3E9_9MICR|nr:hypothetical protein H312_00712 [Anncaliia algerae PRA339]